MKGIIVRMSDELHRKFKLALVKKGESAQKVLERAVRDYVKKVEKKEGSNET
ncbi:hypothetical protein [Thermovirga lienii]|uniref:hypothetical protein n=1 Tax=Thermovirga lienii TaxID=336261 RepID=UPI002FDF8F54